MNNRTSIIGEQRLTRVGRSITPQSPHFITIEGGKGVTEDKSQRRHSKRLETTEDRRSSMGAGNTRYLRRLFSTCGFLLRDYNDLGSCSASYHSPIIRRVLSGSENESAHHAVR